MNSGDITMSKPQSTTQIMKISEVRGQLNSLVNQVYRRETRVVVEKSGIPVAGIVSVDDLRRLDQLDKQREADLALVDELRNAFQDVPDEEIERESDRALNQVRDEIHGEQEQVTGKS
jgi:prevent-host-death family protein